ncbi:restriction endonuclease subunit S [Burkholderia vietnamiensis]|uniref:restriction endonuclease subunit S n=1 Tax=Burkholderia vietnamiensis TaxID=60552 RepID=UPI001CF2D7DD|nr:restriction endonuclease subunit S [Burkholderia vietnamiensis]MCA8197871.1 restriction endonuclease subunit S [Burkholderia vietnamiensis]
MTLREAGITLIDCDHRTPPAQDSGYPYIAIPQLKDGHIRLDGSERRISASDYADWTKKLLPQQHDVIVVRRCNSGDSAVVPAALKCAIGQNLVVLRSDGSKVFPPFLRWLVRSDEWWEQVRKYLNVGAVFDSLKCKEIPLFELPVPSLDVQREIALLLQAVDDRITLLRETNATLEAIAQALFKSWFVNFDPVRAKQEGRAPEGIDEATAALFPDAFEESDFGLVPRGWRIGKLEDLLILQRGFDLPASERVPGSYPIIAASGPSGTHHSPMAKAPGVVTGRSGVLGRVFLELDDYWPLNTTLWVKEFRAASPCYAYEVLQLLDFPSFNAGSAVPTLNRNHIHSLPHLIPSRECVDAYEAMAMTLHRRVRENQKQAQTLAASRDTLLPRLISGQLRLPEVEAEALAA